MGALLPLSTFYVGLFAEKLSLRWIIVQAAATKLRIFSFCFSLIRPTAMASITPSAKPHLIFILFIPRMVCSSKPRETSNRLSPVLR